MKSKLLASLYSVARFFYFKLDPELVHNSITRLGKTLGKIKTSKDLIKSLFFFASPALRQKIAGIEFGNPIGLSAGFDYNAELTQILPSVGFGFASVGTITNLPYEGNPRPRLGRLPKSKSLLVNKGFKNKGTDIISGNLSRLIFAIPIGISIGRSNSSRLKTLEESIDDIVASFKKFEKSGVKHSYYELNISCPNLIHGGQSITFYPPKNLEILLSNLDSLRLKKPMFVKMPISEPDENFKAMLEVIARHKVSGVIIGNLQKDRSHPSFDKSEIKKAKNGNFSGIPCRARSNELISLAYKTVGSKLVIVGCGGVFGAHDAYEKIKLGSSLVMLITGMIYKGPQLIGQINRDLVKLLKEDGYKNISEAVGAYHF